LLIPLVALLALVIGAVLIVRQQRKAGPTMPVSPGGGTGGGLAQAVGETREDFVRRNRDRPGVVANGATLVDLYDRIRHLEERLAALEGDRDGKASGHG
jgi:hypothetical protein